MVDGQGLPRLALMANSGAFGLPWFVAVDEGLFIAEGLEVVLLPRDPLAPERPLFARRKEGSLRRGESDMYTVCAWAPFTDRFGPDTNTRIVYAATMESPYAIVARADGPVRAPADLGDRPIAVKMEAGSHFATVDLLEGTLPPERLRLTHVGGPLRRLAHLLEGRVAAATLMEHYVDVAVANGCRVIAAGRYPEIIAGRGDLDPETLRRFVRAVNRAIERIEVDPARYLPLVYAELPPHLARPARPPRFAYVRPTAYDRRTFERTARWMQARGFVERAPRYEDVALTPPSGG